MNEIMETLRPAVEVWKDINSAWTEADQDFDRNANEHTDDLLAASMIEADRAAVEAATVAKIVDWLRVQQHGRTSDNYPSYYARRIEDGEWK